MANPIMKVS